jgi:hypothetical protein
VEPGRAHGQLLLSLEGTDLVPGRGREIEAGQPIADGVEGPHRRAVAVLVMGDDQAVREAIERPGLDGMGATCW